MYRYKNEPGTEVNLFSVFLAICLCCSIFHARATPLISEPKFIQVSTEQGLSQDTVRSLLVDKDGFLWIATDGGLNRYDGYRVEQINGPNQELTDVPVYNLFQASSGHLWIGTLESGLYKMDLGENQLQKMGDWRFKYQPEWLQDPAHFIEPLAGRIIVAFNQLVVQFEDEKTSVLFELPDDLILEQHSIRHIWSDNQVLLVATTNGLYGVDLASENVVKVDHLGTLPPTLDNVNVKYLLSYQDTLWMGTVEGMFSFPLTDLKGFVLGGDTPPRPELRVRELNIWKILPDKDQHFYLATNEGMYTYWPGEDQLQHLFQPTDSRYYLTDNNIVDMVSLPNGNVWMASFYDGALLWSPRSMQFTNILKYSAGDYTLSNNLAMSLHQEDESRLWIGTNNGLNLYHLTDGEIEPFLVTSDSKAQYSASSIYQIFQADENHLWYVNSEGLGKFDTQQFTDVPVVVSGEQQKALISGNIWSALKDEQGDVWMLKDDGVYRFDVDAGVVTKSELIDKQLDPSSIQALLPDYADTPHAILVATKGVLYRYDYRRGTLLKLHELADRGLQHKVAVDSVLIDKNGVLWLSYPGFGLFGLDAETLEQKFVFDSSNLLPNNSIYGMQMDNDGNIWMGSHRGLLKFYPENQHLQKYSYAEGVVSPEFNQGAKTVLHDGRMVYGSQKGVTLFNPELLSEHGTEAFSVSITGLSLTSNPMPTPLRNLSGEAIDLKHDDIGLTISFSTLTYNYQSNTRYQYELSGANNIRYPATFEPQVSFATLKPGNYQFKVTALDPVTGNRSEPSEISIRVRHAPWASPEAYTFYFLLTVVLFLLWRQRKNTQERQIRTAHSEALKSKNRLSLALTASNSNVWEWSAEKNVFYAPRVADELGYKELGSDISFAQHLALVHPDDRQRYESSWQRFLANQEPGFDVTFRMKTVSDQWYWYRDVGSVVSETHQFDKLVVSGTYSNITESLANREKVRLFGEAFKHTRDWVAIFNSEGNPIAVNTAFSEVFGIDEHKDLAPQFKRVFTLEGQQLPRFWDKLKELDAQEYWQGEETLVKANGKRCNVLINMTSISSVRAQTEIEYYLLIMSDISEQKEAESELRRLANFDSLTNLPNRTLLLDRINHAIDHANRNKTTLGLFFIDLDRFKQVNDSLGHKAGDELLRVIGQRLTQLLRKDDTVARLGGDEFVVMVEDVTHPDKLSNLASEVIAKLEAPVQLGNQTVSVSSSVGIALFPGDADNSEELLRNADLAMYHAKELGRSNFQYFTEHMNQLAQARLAMENQLKNAYQKKGFINYFQPIVNLDSGLVEGFELLMRWPTEEGMIPPDKFIPVAEEIGLIEKMTWDALAAAIPVLALWQSVGRPVYLSVNLSARHFERQVSIEQILTLLETHQLPVSCLRFEITESALMRDYERALEYMEAMCEKGFVIALDDFGTGYSSLKYLKEFPIEVLKIDKSFVNDIGKDKNNEAIIITTLRMAESLNMQCVAEGIEEQSHVEFFKPFNCKKLQGYYFSVPVPSEKTHDLLRKNWQL